MVVSHNHPSLAQLLSRRKDVDNDRFEVRLYAVSLASIFGYWVMEPGFYILMVMSSAFTKAAILTRHPEVVGWGFILAGLCAVPMMVWSSFRKKPTKHDRLPRQIITRGALLGALLYAMLFYSTKGTDFDSVVRGVFVVRFFVCLWFGFLFSRSLNSQAIRERARKEGVELNTDYRDDLDKH